jgi:hypothetical protein
MTAEQKAPTPGPIGPLARYAQWLGQRPGVGSDTGA